MPRLARRLEELFREMQEAAELGKLPVPNLQNLDIYYEVGAELLQTPIEFETDEAYQKRYMDKLVRRNASEPLAIDAGFGRVPDLYPLCASSSPSTNDTQS